MYSGEVCGHDSDTRGFRALVTVGAYLEGRFGLGDIAVKNLLVAKNLSSRKCALSFEHPMPHRRFYYTVTTLTFGQFGFLHCHFF